MPGPIASEVIEGLTSGERPIPIEAIRPLPVTSIKPVNVQQEPGAKPLEVLARNIPKIYSAAWWFQNGGPVGIMCFAFLGASYWMANSQKESQKALVQSLQDANKASNEERQAIIKVLLTTQADISSNMARMAHSIDRIEGRLDKKD